MHQLYQLLKRLFPFGRGLCHAYWAPNIWVAYNLADKLLVKVLGARSGSAGTASMTGGLVGSGQVRVCFQINPLTRHCKSFLVPSFSNLNKEENRQNETLNCLPQTFLILGALAWPLRVASFLPLPNP